MSTSFSTRTWRRLQLGVTAALFVVATTAGVAVAGQAPAVSPVAPAAAAVVVAPAAPQLHGGVHGHGRM